ncbi:hypothetical protein B0H12DRAFT_1243859 [Mycena haematopus]|nr:hypothetical protein B0H12DRAFT_1243859 [Mycena haematopus]
MLWSTFLSTAKSSGGRRAKDSRQRKTIANTNSTCLRSIPWLSLLLVCKTIANELRYHVHTSGNVAYELEVDNLQCRYSIAHDVTWRRIPCPPSSVRILRADLVFNLETRFWGAGGPMSILSELYQLLNCFIHNGPLLVRGSPLVKHLHLESLILQIRVTDPDPEERRAEGQQPYTRETVVQMKKWLYSDLKEYISMVVDRGLLFGAVDEISCRAANYDSDDESGDDSAIIAQWDISRQTVGDMTEWNTYDFTWGVPGSSSLELDESESDATAEDVFFRSHLLPSQFLNTFLLLCPGAASPRFTPHLLPVE